MRVRTRTRPAVSASLVRSFQRGDLGEVLGGEERRAAAVALGVAGDGERIEERVVAVEEDRHRDRAGEATGAQPQERLAQHRHVGFDSVGDAVVIEGPAGFLGPGRKVERDESGHGVCSLSRGE